MNFWRVPIDAASGRRLGPPEPVDHTGTVDAASSGFSRDARRLAFVASEERSSLYRIAFDPRKRVRLVGNHS